MVDIYQKMHPAAMDIKCRKTLAITGRTGYSARSSFGGDPA